MLMQEAVVAFALFKSYSIFTLSLTFSKYFPPSYLLNSCTLFVFILITLLAVDTSMSIHTVLKCYCDCPPLPLLFESFDQAVYSYLSFEIPATFCHCNSKGAG